jgi:hypothetical protein
MKKIAFIISSLLLLALGFQTTANRQYADKYALIAGSPYYTSIAPPQTAANQPIIDQAVFKGRLGLWRHTAEVRMAFIIVLAALLAIALIFAFFKSYLLMRGFETRIGLAIENEELKKENVDLKPAKVNLENRLLAVGNERIKFINDIKTLLSGHEKDDFLIQIIQKKLSDEMHKISASD